MTGNPPSSSNAREVAYWNSPPTQSWNESFDAIDAFFADATRASMVAARVRPGDHVVDVGCGSGTTVLELSDRVGITGRVLGIDVSQRSVDRARRRLAEASRHNAEIVLADVTEHPFADNSFDLAYSRFGVMFFSDPRATLRHLRAAMKPAGRLTFLVFRTAQENTWASAPFAAVKDVLPPVPASVPDAPGMFSWADPKRVESILADAGFERITLSPLDLDLMLAPQGGAEQAADFIPTIGPLLRAMSTATDHQRESARSRLVSFFVELDRPKGIWLKGAFWTVHATAPME